MNLLEPMRPCKKSLTKSNHPNEVSGMRLSQEKIANLKGSISRILPHSDIYLFGSRVDNEEKGGDIDIMILADRTLDFREKGEIEKSFFKEFGEQKLDIVSFDYEDSSSFKDYVLQGAVKL